MLGSVEKLLEVYLRNPGRLLHQTQKILILNEYIWLTCVYVFVSGMLPVLVCDMFFF